MIRLSVVFVLGCEVGRGYIEICNCVLSGLE